MLDLDFENINHKLDYLADVQKLQGQILECILASVCKDWTTFSNTADRYLIRLDAIYDKHLSGIKIRDDMTVGEALALNRKAEQNV